MRLLYFFSLMVYWCLSDNSISDLEEMYNIQKRIEKIYCISREMLDSFLDENPFCVGSDCYFSAISILRKATRIAMLSYTELSSFWSHDVFKEIYHITTEKTIQYKNIEQIVSDTLSIEKTLAHPTKKSLSEPSQKKNKEKHSIKRTAISQQMLSKIVKKQKKKRS